MKKHHLLVAFTAICMLLQVQAVMAQNKTVVGTPSNPIKQPEDKPMGGGATTLPGLTYRSNGSTSGQINQAKSALETSGSPKGNGSMSNGGAVKPPKPAKPAGPKAPTPGGFSKGQFRKMSGLFEKFMGAVGEGGINIGELLNDLIDNNGNTSVKNVISGDGSHLTSFCIFNCTTIYTNNGDSYQQIVITDANGKVLGTASTAPSKVKK